MTTTSPKPCRSPAPAPKRLSTGASRPLTAQTSGTHKRITIDERQRRSFVQEFESKFQPDVWACLNTNKPIYPNKLSSAEDQYRKLVQKYANIIARETKQEVFVEGVFDYNPTNPQGFINGHLFIRFEKHKMSPSYIAQTWVAYLKQQNAKEGGRLNIVDWETKLGDVKKESKSSTTMNQTTQIKADRDHIFVGEQEQQTYTTKNGDKVIKKAEAFVVSYESRNGKDGYNTTLLYGIEGHTNYITLVGCSKKGPCRRGCVRR